MILSKRMQIQFVSCVRGEFQDETGEMREYYDLHYFPVDADGTIGDVPEKVGVPKELVPSFASVKRGAILDVMLTSYVKRPKVSEFEEVG